MNNRIGIAFFDTVKRAVSGHKYVDGKLTMFESLGELENDVLWITNVPFSDFSKQELWRHSNFRDEQFARLSVTQILRELGSSKNKDLGVYEAAGYLLTKSIHSLTNMFPIDICEEKYRLSNSISKHVLPEIYQSYPSNIDNEAIEACNNSFQALQGAQKGRLSKAKLHYFSFPRGNFYSYIINQNLPIDNNWSHADFKEAMTVGTADGETLPNTEAVIESLKQMHLDKALLLKINIKRIDKKYQQGFYFANTGFNKNSRPRVWATLPEVIDILRYCHITINECYSTSNGKLDIRPELDTQNIRYDYAQGIIAENIFNALSDKVTHHGKQVHTGLGAYLKAYDRLMTGKLAEAFMAAGFALGGFGMAGVRVWAPRDKVLELKKIALNFGATMDIGGESR